MTSLINGIILFCAALLFFCCISPFISVETAPFLSMLSLGVPLFFLANLLLIPLAFFFRKRLGWLSFLSVVLCLILFGPFYKIGSEKESNSEGALSVMSYNTLGFDMYDWIQGGGEAQKIISFVKSEKPDIICFQEFAYKQANSFPDYPYNYIHYGSSGNNYTMQAIYSKFPILKKGSLNFPTTVNNTIFADILYKKDTLRVYNMHLQSFQMHMSRRFLMRMGGSNLYKRMSEVFIKQQEQAKIIREHQATTPYRKILCGDFNNTQFSRVYHLVKGEMKDSYLEKGQGIGATFKVKSIPLRIDAILADPEFTIESHTNYRLRVSDHYPIMATFSLTTTGDNNPPDRP